MHILEQKDHLYKRKSTRRNHIIQRYLLAHSLKGIIMNGFLLIGKCNHFVSFNISISEDGIKGQQFRTYKKLSILLSRGFPSQNLLYNLALYKHNPLHVHPSSNQLNKNTVMNPPRAHKLSILYYCYRDISTV